MILSEDGLPTIQYYVITIADTNISFQGFLRTKYKLPRKLVGGIEKNICVYYFTKEQSLLLKLL